MKTRICHISTVHPRHDTRILLKECISLHQSGYQVSLIVADGRGAENFRGVAIHDVGAHKGGRVRRVLGGLWRTWKWIPQVPAEIYHFHDSELIPLGLLLRFTGRQVVYDVHEDLARSFANRNWIPSIIKPFLALATDLLERMAARCCNLVVAATPIIQARIGTPNAITVRNWPIIEEFTDQNLLPYNSRPLQVVYIGSLSEKRGVLHMIRAINHPILAGRVRLVICGAIDDSNDAGLEQRMREEDAAGLMDYRGHLNRSAVAIELSRARAGLVVLQPNKAYLDSLPTKMFEYMAAGLPVIASNFPLWCELLDKGTLGLLVDPTDPARIADAICQLIDYPAEATALGQRGKTAAMNQFNWTEEKNILLAAYAKLLAPKAARYT